MSTKNVCLNLEVHEAHDDDVYRDIARISHQVRQGLEAGKIHKFKTEKGTVYLVLRGNGKTEEANWIRLDENTRDKLGLQRNERVNFSISEASFWGQLLWSWRASDPAYRVAAKLGVLSLVLAIASVLPLVWSIFINLAKLVLYVREVGVRLCQ